MPRTAPPDFGNPFEKVSFREIILQKMRLGVQQRVAMELLLQRADFRQHQDHITKAMVLNLFSYVWADQPKQVEVVHPADWWQHFKQRWFPKWALKRWPVRMARHILEAQHFYPQLPQGETQHSARLRMTVRHVEEEPAAKEPYRTKPISDWERDFPRRIHEFTQQFGRRPTKCLLGRREFDLFECSIRSSNTQAWAARHAEYMGVEIEPTNDKTHFQLTL